MSVSDPFVLLSRRLSSIESHVHGGCLRMLTDEHKMIRGQTSLVFLAQSTKETTFWHVSLQGTKVGCITMSSKGGGSLQNSGTHLLQSRRSSCLNPLPERSSSFSSGSWTDQFWSTIRKGGGQWTVPNTAQCWRMRWSQPYGAVAEKFT